MMKRIGVNLEKERLEEGRNMKTEKRGRKKIHRKTK
jgi:hypothetical protein